MASRILGIAAARGERSPLARGGFRIALVALVACGLVACGESGRRYEGTGRVEEVIAEEAQVVIAHDEIPGLMDAMTMSFDVSGELLAAVTAGDRVRFTLLVSQGGMRLVELAPVATGPGTKRMEVERRFAAARGRGEMAPAFSLTDQNGSALALEDLAGRTLLVDFIFTECEGPCPILTAKHVAVQRALAPEVAEKSWFVSISVDPRTDTPELLTRYANERGVDLGQWSFLTGDPDTVSEVVAAYGVGTTRNEQGTLEHLVAAFLVDAQGRIVRRYLGLEHSSAEIAADIADLASLDS